MNHNFYLLKLFKLRDKTNMLPLFFLFIYIYLHVWKYFNLTYKSNVRLVAFVVYHNADFDGMWWYNIRLSYADKSIFYEIGNLEAKIRSYGEGEGDRDRDVRHGPHQVYGLGRADVGFICDNEDVTCCLAHGGPTPHVNKPCWKPYRPTLHLLLSQYFIYFPLYQYLLVHSHSHTVHIHFVIFYWVDFHSTSILFSQL